MEGRAERRQDVRAEVVGGSGRVWRGIAAEKGGRGAAELGKLFTRKGNTQMRKKGVQTEFQKQKNETRPPRMFSLGPWGYCRPHEAPQRPPSPHSILHRKAVQMFLRADLRFPCFLLASPFPALRCCQGAPFTRRWRFCVFFFCFFFCCFS